MEKVNKARVVEENNMTGSKNILVAPEQIIFEEGGCIKRRSHLEKCLFVFVILFVLVSIGLLAALIITWRSGDRQDVCLTEDCVKTAAMISDSLDYSVEPCDNFYDFACGNWRKKHIIPEDKTSYGIIDELFKTVDIALKNALEKKIMPGEPEAVTKTKTLYASCMNSTGIESRGVQPLLSFLDKFGRWPVVTSGWREADFNFVDAMSTITLYNSFKWDVLPVFSTVVKADTKQSTQYIIYINQPSFGMPGREYYLKGRNDTMVKAYEDLAVKVAVVLGATQDDAAKQMEEMVDFEVNLANISVSLEKRRNLTALYNKMTISHLQSIYPQFEWLRYFQAIFQTKGVDIIINDSLFIINEVPEYFSRLFQLLSSTPPRILSNYIGWRITKSFLTDLTNELDNLNTNYKKIIFGTSVSVPRWQKCAEYTKNGLKMAAGRMFVDETFDKAAKDNIMVMIDNLRSVFKEQLECNKWMDEETKQVAREKVEAIGENVGYPDEILDNNYLNNLYNNYEYGDNYFENILKTEYELSIEALKRLNIPVDRTSWSYGFGPATVNANYKGETNYIEFPAAFLQPRYYSKTYPNSVNYGGVGMVIGHEITHGFDDLGRQYDKNGNVRQWWTTQVISRFKEEAQCVIDQYSNFTVPEINLNINGINTQGENIADIGGIKQAYQAYRKWIKERGMEEARLPGLIFNHDQLLFISFAQTFCGNMRAEEAKQRILTEYHSPDRFRIIGACQNSEDFSRVFECPVNSYMNPKRKCSVW